MGARLDNMKGAADKVLNHPREESGSSIGGYTLLCIAAISIARLPN